MLVIERGKLERESRGACGVSSSGALPPLVESVLIDALHAIAQRDDVFGGLPDETQRGTDQRHRDRIGRMRQRIASGLEVGHTTLTSERMLAWRIGQLVALLIERQKNAPVLVHCGGRQRFAPAPATLSNRYQEELCCIAIKIRKTCVSLFDHPTNQQAQLLEYRGQRDCAGPPTARRRVGRQRPQISSRGFQQRTPLWVSEGTAIGQIE